MMRSRTWTAAAALAGSLVLAGCGEGASSDAESPADDDAAGGTQGDAADEDPVEGAVPAPAGSAADLTAVLRDADGNEVGEVELTATGDGTELRVEVQGLPPGFHGTHVHTNPACEPGSTDPEDPSQSGDFLSAGGHLGAEEADHGAHPGDLPPLYVTEAGGGVLLTQTDGFTVDALESEGGAALIVHSGRDNLAHIPERYAPDGPDEDTLATGDAGDRLACAVLGPDGT